MIIPTFTEVLIVMIGFGVVGAYLAVARQFINSSEDKNGGAKTPSTGAH